MRGAARHYTCGDGLKLFFRDWNSGASHLPPLVCLPGLTRNSFDYEIFAQRLGRSRRVICPDYRGRGQSAYDPDWRRYRPQTYLDDLRHLLAAEGISKVVLVGTSMGGLLGMALQSYMPGLLAGLVLNDVGPELHGPGLGRILNYIGKDRPQPDWQSAVAVVKRLMPSLSVGDDETGWLRVAQGTYREGDDGKLHFDWDVRLAQALTKAGNIPADLWAMFRSLADVPVLAVRGENSDVLSPEVFARMKQELPHLRQITVPGCGHCPSLCEPEAAEEIDGFLAAID